jgi:hypothetical protein
MLLDKLDKDQNNCTKNMILLLKPFNLAVRLVLAGFRELKL